VPQFTQRRQKSHVNKGTPRIGYAFWRCSLKGEPVADTLDQDVQALQEWLKKAWRYLAQPSHTRFDRGEMRQQMKLVEAKLRIGLQKAAARNNASQGVEPRPPDLAPANWRLLKVSA
jgi:hypothetical protein